MTGWCFGTFSIFPYIWNVIIPIDFHIFQRGSNHQPDVVELSIFLREIAIFFGEIAIFPGEIRIFLDEIFILPGTTIISPGETKCSLSLTW